MAKGKYHEWLTPEGLIRLEGWARDGLTDVQIAENMGISPATLYDWKNKYPEIVESLKMGKEVVDRQVENALLRSALGFEYEEEVATPRGDVLTVRKYEKPNTTAQIFWLKNRKRAEWRDKQEVDLSGDMKHEVNVQQDLSKLSVQELKQLEEIISKTADTD